MIKTNDSEIKEGEERNVKNLNHSCKKVRSSDLEESQDMKKCH
jgi:hypothetical protein